MQKEGARESELEHERERGGEEGERKEKGDNLHRGTSILENAGRTWL